MVEIRQFDIPGAYQRGYAFGTQQRQLLEDEQRKSGLSRLAAQSFAAPPSGQRSLLSQMAAIDPAAAYQQQKQFEGTEDRRLQRLGAAARYLDAARQTGDKARVQGAWQAVRPMLQEELPDAQYQDQWDDATMAPVLYQVLAATGGAGVGGNVLSTYVNGDGIRMAIMRDGSQRPLGEAENRLQLRDQPGMPLGAFDPRQGTISPVQEAPSGGGATQTAPAASPQVYIDPSLPAEIQADIRANPQKWEAAAAGQSLPSSAVASAATGVAASRPEISAAEQERLELARQANQRAIGQYDLAVRAAERADRQEQRQVQAQAVTGKPPTEGERKAATLLKRLEGSLSQLQTAVTQDPSASGPSVLAEIGRSLPFVGDAAANVLNTSERQRVEAAQLDILDAALTLGTGAAYTREQLQGYRRSYFPQLGDSPETIKDKQSRLQNVISAARIAAGRAAGGAASGTGLPAAPRESNQESVAPGAPAAGAVMDGYRFRGGNPADPNAWEKI